MVVISAIPETSGVYLLYQGQECIYVGYSFNMRKRITYHRLRGKFDRVEALPMPAWEMAAEEFRLLQLYKPRHNKRIGYTRARRVLVGDGPWYWDKTTRKWVTTL